MTSTSAPADYRAILEPASTAVVRTALELGIFRLLSRDARTPAQVAALTSASLRGIERLLPAMWDGGLLTRVGEEYSLAPAARSFALLEGDDVIRDFAGIGHPFDAIWASFGDVVRRGGPSDALDTEQFFADMVPGLERLHRPLAAAAAAELGVPALRRGARVLDVACGSAVWSRAIAAADPSSRVTAQDLPAVLERAQTAIGDAGLVRQYAYLPGSLEAIDLGAAEYDVVIVAHILHLLSERACGDLVARARAALKPGGVLMIVEFVGDAERRGPRFALLFALLMLLLSPNGDVWTFGHLREWASAAGLTAFRSYKDQASEATLVFCSE